MPFRSFIKLVSITCSTSTKRDPVHVPRRRLTGSSWRRLRVRGWRSPSPTSLASSTTYALAAVDHVAAQFHRLVVHHRVTQTATDSFRALKQRHK